MRLRGRLAVSLFSLLWRSRIGSNRVVAVTGWRSCLWDAQPGNYRQRVTFCVRGLS